MKILLLVFVIISTSGCYASGGYYPYSYYQPYYNPGYVSNFGHQIREERMRQQLRRQHEAFEEYNLQEQIRNNEQQLERLKIRSDYGYTR